MTFFLLIKFILKFDTLIFTLRWLTLSCLTILVLIIRNDARDLCKLTEKVVKNNWKCVGGAVFWHHPKLPHHTVQHRTPTSSRSLNNTSKPCCFKCVIGLFTHVPPPTSLHYILPWGRCFVLNTFACSASVARNLSMHGGRPRTMTLDGIKRSRVGLSVQLFRSE